MQGKFTGKDADLIKLANQTKMMQVLGETKYPYLDSIALNNSVYKLQRTSDRFTLEQRQRASIAKSEHVPRILLRTACLQLETNRTQKLQKLRFVHANEAEMSTRMRLLRSLNPPPIGLPFSTERFRASSTCLFKLSKLEWVWFRAIETGQLQAKGSQSAHCQFRRGNTLSKF